MFDLEKASKLFDVKRLVCACEYRRTSDLLRLSDTGDFYRLLYVEEGSIYFEVNGLSYYLGAENIFICPPFSRFKIKSKDIPAGYVTSVYDISFTADSKELDKIVLQKLFCNAKAHKFAKDLVSCELLGKSYADIRGGCVNISCVLEFKLKLELLLNALLTLRSKDDRVHPVKLGNTVDAALELMRANIHENLSVEQIADRLYVSRSTLVKNFGKVMNMGVLNCFIEMKIKKSIELMSQHPEMSMTEISQALGFSSVTYFSRLFKKHVGVSPTNYKMQKKEQ